MRDNISGVRPIEITKKKIVNGWPVQKYEFNGKYWNFLSGEKMWKGKKDLSNGIGG